MRVAGFLLTMLFVATMAASADARGSRNREPEHGGTPCVNECKEPWRVCYRNVCFSTPGYKNAPGLKRAAIEKVAKAKCAGEWQKFRACKKRCKVKAELPTLKLLARLAPTQHAYCAL